MIKRLKVTYGEQKIRTNDSQLNWRNQSCFKKRFLFPRTKDIRYSWETFLPLLSCLYWLYGPIRFACIKYTECAWV